jgi:hypothetical protein
LKAPQAAHTIPCKMRTAAHASAQAVTAATEVDFRDLPLWERVCGRFANQTLPLLP